MSGVKTIVLIFDVAFAWKATEAVAGSTALLRHRDADYYTLLELTFEALLCGFGQEHSRSMCGSS